MESAELNPKHIYICFPGGRNKALTMSYDDGICEDRRLVEIFNRNGIKGTFNLNSGLMGGSAVDLSEIKDLYKGHEIAAHSYSHPNLVRMPGEQVIRQIMLDRCILEQYCGYPVRGMALPYGTYNTDLIGILKNCGIEYCRTVGNTDDFSLPEDFMKWKPTCKHDHNLMENAERFAELKKTEHLYLMYVWGHSFEFNRPYGADWKDIQEFCEFIGGRDEIWYAANIEISDYMNAAKRLKYTADCSKVLNTSSVSVWIRVNGEICEIPPGKIIDI